jgi:hypothetical protein
MIGARANKIIDKLHHATVGVLVVSTVYFGFEAVRATMAIQKYKYEQKVRYFNNLCVCSSHAAAGRQHVPAAAAAAAAAVPRRSLQLKEAVHQSSNECNI